jgi:hypothetical protein
MSTIVTFFLAPDDAAAAAVADEGPDDVYETIDLGNFDPAIALAEWESVLSGRSFDQVVDGVPVVVEPPDGDGAWVFAASPALQSALAGADERQLTALGAEWARLREEDGLPIDPTLTVEIVREVAELSRGAGRVYCWTC